MPGITLNDPCCCGSLECSECARRMSSAELIRRFAKALDALSPAEREAMWEAQRASWVRGMAPTGDPRFD